MREVTVSDIHRYPPRPEGFEEPLFSTEVSRRQVAEHLLRAPWLARASDLRKGPGSTAHAREEPVKLARGTGGVHVVRPRAGHCSWQRRRVVEVLDRWRCVRSWWAPEEQADRLLFRVLLSGSTVVDLALEHPGRWLLAGVVD